MQTVSTGDHRYGDAAIFVVFFNVVRDYLSDPENFDHTKYKDIPHYSEVDQAKKAAATPVVEVKKAEPVP